MHQESSPLKGKKVLVKDHVPRIGGMVIEIQNWVDRLLVNFNPNAIPGGRATMNYADRRGFEQYDPEDDDVLYGKVYLNEEVGTGFVVHIDELELPE